MINVLTIEREYGSGAADIAQKVAERLGWKLWDQALTDEIARHLECDRGTCNCAKNAATRFTIACSSPSCAAASREV